MNYVILLPELKRGGPNNVIKNLVTSDIFSKCNVYLLCLRESEDIAYKNEFLCKKNIKIIALDKSGYFSKIKQIKKIILEISPDVVHSHGFYPDIYSSFLKGNFKKICTIHNIIYQDYSSRYGKKGYLFSAVHYIFLKYSKFDKIFGCSIEVANSLSKIIRKNNIEYVNNGIDIKKFNLISLENKKDLKKQLGLESQILISFCGSVERVKRVPELVDEYISKIEKIDFKFIIIGDGPELSLIKENENIIKVGRLNDPSRYLKISDVVVSNSSSEGYPMAILEALASGCKVFLSDIPSHNYIIDSYPFCAFELDSLNNEFILKVLKNKLSEDDLYTISAKKMAQDYLDKI